MIPRDPFVLVRLLVRLLAAVLILVPALPAAQAQIPDTFENLKLLDPGISKPELIDTMRSWAQGLGVRCNHCHVGPDNLQGMDFASDEKATKRTARRMLEMSRALNGDLLADLPTVADGGRHQVVSCFTCHRGQSTPPHSLASVIVRLTADEGIDAALTRYEELRAEHYGAGVYDFSEASLTAAARDLADSGRTDDAIRLLQANETHYPESADLHAAIGLFQLQAGDPAAARAALERALALDPANRMAQRALQALAEPATPPAAPDK